MSIRAAALKAVEEESVQRAHKRALIEQIGTGPITDAHMDAYFLAEPLRDKKPTYHHFRPTELAIVFAKAVAVEGLLVLSAEEVPAELTSQDPKRIATFAARKLWKPMLKDLSITSMLKLYQAAYAHLYAAGGKDLVAAGRAVRKAGSAAIEAFQVRSSTQSDAWYAALAVRADVARHVAFHVLPIPAVLGNLAVVTVEEADLLLTAAAARIQKQRAEAVIMDKDAGAKAKAVAARTLAELEVSRRQVDVVQESLLNVIRCGSGVLLEVVAAFLGTFIYPGLGTTIGSHLGSAITWMVI